MDLVLVVVQCFGHADDATVPEGFVRLQAQNAKGHALSVMMSEAEAAPFVAVWGPYKQAVDAAIEANTGWPSAPTVALHVELGG